MPAATAAPFSWSRRLAGNQSKSLSVEAQEFVPSKSLSVEAPEFVPSKDAPEFVPQKDAVEFVPSKDAPVFVPSSNGNCCMISLGAYSDDSSEDSSDEEAPPAIATKVEVEAAKESVQSSLTAQRPWRVSASEFVPRGFVSQSETPSSILKTNEAGSTKLPPWKRASLPTPKAEEEACLTPSSSPLRSALSSSVCTLSTSEGSPSSAVSQDDVSSVSSASPRAVSPAPSLPPASLQDVTFAPLTLHSLLCWRLANSACPDASLPIAAQPEPGTPAAAIAAAAAQAASTGSELPAKVLTPQRKPKAAPAGNATPSGRRGDVQVEQSWRTAAPPPLEVSDDGWLARQRNRRKTIGGSDFEARSDEEMVRTTKSILNKLTVEKFDSLFEQLINCGISSQVHLEILIREVFEKATTQHHFIDMYADLCYLLHKHGLIEDTTINFKKILLSCCQSSFEKNLTPPSGLAALNGEERKTAELVYKMRMLGNIRFVGALFVRKMLASKVMLSIMEELLHDPTPETLESLAAFLTVVGPTFDTPDWAYRSTLNTIFEQVEKLVKKPSTGGRTRCLLKDLLDLRSLGWNDMKPKRIEGPLKLEQVAAKAASENSNGWTSQKPRAETWEVSGSRMDKLSEILSSKTSTPYMASKPTSARNPAPAEKTNKASFDQEACREEIAKALKELRVSHDVPEAIMRIANIAVPVAQQASELDRMLTSIVEESSQDVRKAGFDVVAGLFIETHWKPQLLSNGLHGFIENTCSDLKHDVPALPRILREELHPAFAPLVKARLLEAEQQGALLAV